MTSSTKRLLRVWPPILTGPSGDQPHPGTPHPELELQCLLTLHPRGCPDAYHHYPLHPCVTTRATHYVCEHPMSGSGLAE